MILVHGDLTGTYSQVLGLFESLGNLDRIIAAGTLDSVCEENTGIIAESREYIRSFVVLLLVSVDEALDFLILIGVVSGEVGVVESVLTGQLNGLGIIPAVGAEDRAGECFS